MIPVAFDYVRPKRLDEAKALLAQAGADAVILAGGQSLMTELKLRRIRPRLVVDIGGVPDLDGVDVGADGLAVGAMARQASVARAATAWPLLAEIAAAAADPMVRHRGTLVGAFCQADPGGDWVAAGLVLDSRLEVSGPTGIRQVALADVVAGPGLGGGEIAIAAHIPPLPAGARSVYRKVKHIGIGWSVASAAVVLAPMADGRAAGVRVAVSGATSHPQRLPQLEEALTQLNIADEGALDQAIATALSSLSYRGDAYASADYRAERLGILLRQTLKGLARAGDGPSDAAKTQGTSQ